MDDRDQASSAVCVCVARRLTESNGFLRLLWLRVCVEAVIMCWYLQGTAWCWLLIMCTHSVLLNA